MQETGLSQIMKDFDFFRAKEGDQRAIANVIEQWTPLIHKMANKYGFLAAVHQREDLVQMGRIAVYEAIRSYDPDSSASPATWIWYKVRGMVQGFANKQKKHPKFVVELSDADHSGNLEDPDIFEVREDLPEEFVKKIILAGCRDGLDSKRAQIVCSRFGLLGEKELRQGEVAEKFGLSKQAVNGHLSGFYKRVRKNLPELAELV